MNTSRIYPILLALLTMIAACDMVGGQDITSPGQDESVAGAKRADEIRVMTRNVSIGGNIDRVLVAPSMNEVPLLVAQTWQEIVTNDFHVRAAALAQEIKARDPDIIGLQEITTFRVQDPGDMVFGGTEPATVVAYDYLQILLDALEERGLRYEVAGLIADTEAEMPMVTSPAPTFADVRMTDYDVVLVKPHVSVENVIERNFAYDWSLPFGPEGLTVKRGYVAFDARIGDREFRLISTHLEPVDYPDLQPLQLAQAAELLANQGDGTTIIVGDLNTEPGRPAYEMLVSSGLSDAWDDLPGNAPGYTGGFSPDLLPGQDLDERIDLVLYRNGAGPVLSPTHGVISGRDPIEGYPFLPSDHAGLTVTFAVH